MENEGSAVLVFPYIHFAIMDPCMLVRRKFVLNMRPKLPPMQGKVLLDHVGLTVCVLDSSEQMALTQDFLNHRLVDKLDIDRW